MKTICILSQKGGSGKTTVALALAVHATMRRKLTLVIDLDPQGSSIKWSERRESDAPTVVSAQAVGLPRILDGARADGADLVVIDTAPHSEAASLTAAKASDLVVIPCRGSIHDLEAVENSVTVAQLAKKPVVVLFNAMPPNAPRMAEDARAAVEESYGVPVLPVHLCQRSDHIHAATEGKAPSDYAPQGKAAAEVAAVYQRIMKLVG